MSRRTNLDNNGSSPSFLSSRHVAPPIGEAAPEAQQTSAQVDPQPSAEESPMGAFSSESPLDRIPAPTIPSYAAPEEPVQTETGYKQSEDNDVTLHYRDNELKAKDIMTAPQEKEDDFEINPFLNESKYSFEQSDTDQQSVIMDQYRSSLSYHPDNVFSEIHDGSQIAELHLNDEAARKRVHEENKKKKKEEESEDGEKKKGFLSSFIKGSSNGENKPKRRVTVPRSVQKTIPYRNVYSDGIIEVEEGIFSKTYPIYDVNFSIAPQEDQENIFNLYGDMLNSFGAECLLSLTIHNTSMNQERFNRETLIRMESDGLNVYREEINEMLCRKVAESRNNLVHDKYFTVTLPCPNIEEAVVEFGRIDGLMSRSLRAINKQEVQPLTLEERLEVLYSVYNMDANAPLKKEVAIGKKTISTFDLKSLNAAGVSTKDVIAPISFEFKKDYFKMGDILGRSMFIESYPTYLKTSLLSDFSDLPASMLLTVHFRSMRQDQAIKLIKNQTTTIAASVVTAQKQASKGGYSTDLISPELQKAQEEARKLMDDITTRNQKLFFVTLVLTHFAMNKEELDKNTKALTTIANKHLCQLKTLNYLQEHGLNSSLPLGVNRLKVERLNTTESASVFIPFSVQEWKSKHGFYYGVNAVSRNIILYNRKQGANFNGVILGKPGAGKSFSAKREMVNALLSTNDEIYVIDPENEYLPLIKEMGGEVIRIAVGGDTHINPFDMDIEYADQEDPVTMKSDFIGSICEIVIGGAFGLSPVEKSVIDRCVRLVYEPYLRAIKEMRDKGINTTGDSRIAPTMMEFYNLLKKQPEEEAKRIALALEIYTTGSLNTFAKRTNVNTNNRLIAYDIKDIGTGMKVLGLQICLDSIWNRMIANKRKGKYTWIYIDEAHLLAQHESSAKYVQQVYKRARKWFGIPTIMTQQVEDVLQSKEMRTVISTSNFVMMLDQAPMDKVELGHMFSISEDELSYITNAEPGNGLLYNGKSLVPFQDQFPQNTKLYVAMSTKPEDVAKREAEQAAEFIAKEEARKAAEAQNARRTAV